MKLITTEEHLESALVSTEIKVRTNKTSLPNLDPALLNYMQENLPSSDILEDTEKQRLEFMDKNDIAMEILSYGNSSPQNLPLKDAIPLCQLANDELAKIIAKHSDRYLGLAVLPVGDPQKAASELERAINQLGLRGVLLKGNYQKKFFDDPFFYPIFEMAEKLDVPVYFHPSFIPQEISSHYFNSPQWSGVVSGILSSAGYGWHMDIGIQIIRMITSGIFDRLPNLKIISGHWGEMVPFFLERLDDELTKYTDLKHPFSYYYKNNVYVTPSGILSEPQLQFLLTEIGADHLMYSIDYPYKTPTGIKDFLKKAKLTPEQREKIAHKTAEKLFKIQY